MKQYSRNNINEPNVHKSKINFEESKVEQKIHRKKKYIEKSHAYKTNENRTTWEIIEFLRDWIWNVCTVFYSEYYEKKIELSEMNIGYKW